MPEHVGNSIEVVTVVEQQRAEGAAQRVRMNRAGQRLVLERMALRLFWAGAAILLVIILDVNASRSIDGQAALDVLAGFLDDVWGAGVRGDGRSGGS